MKHEWRKHEKEIYAPKTKPEQINVPKYSYFAIKGKGNPNNDEFAEYIGVLYSLSYAVRMSHKSEVVPDNYYEYTVYPLEGIWDIAETEKTNDNGELNKDKLVFNLMIRQPKFVTVQFAKEIIERTKIKKPHKLLEEVEFISIDEGHCVQIMHKGSYDEEPKSFEKMNGYCVDNKLRRIGMQHREIYLNDARKVEASKLKTVIRIQVEDDGALSVL